MRTSTMAMAVAGFVGFLSTGVIPDSWVLPRGTSVNDNGPRTYRFTVDHTVTDTTGQVVQRQRVSGDYTRGLPGGDAAWSHVTLAESNGPGEISAPGQARAFMEGFRYRTGPGSLDESMKPEFFKRFPATAVFERNLIWDTGMIEMFGQDQFERLSLNTPYHLLSGDVKMPGIGTFHNKDVQLTWTGRSQRNGQDCAVIEYGAFFNPVDIANGGMTLKGRSHYWGAIWVSLSSKQIEYATLQEDVLGDLTLAGQGGPRTISVFRSGRFEPLK
jgi:hypothetical protein